MTAGAAGRFFPASVVDRRSSDPDGKPWPCHGFLRFDDQRLREVKVRRSFAVDDHGENWRPPVARIAIIVGNPRKDTFSEALAHAYARGAEAGGHEVKTFVLSRLSFDPILHDGFAKPQPLEPDLAAAQAAIGNADHIVFIFPLWFGTLPALLKGFIERVFQPGFAITGTIKEGTYRALLSKKSARIIMTMGMPGLVYRWYYGAYCAKMLKRNILEFVGIKPVRTTIHGMIEAVSNETRAGWLRDAEQLGRSAL